MQRLIAAALLALFATQAQAAKLYVSEYKELGNASGHVAQVALDPPLAEQVVDYSGGVASSNAFKGSTQYVRIICDTQCSVQFGTAPTATTSTKLVPALTPEYFGVSPGNKISVISNP